MINLLPPELKQEIAYSKRNAVLRRYIILAAITLAGLSAALFSTHLYLDRQAAAVSSQIQTKQQRIGSYAKLVKQATSLTSRLQAIQEIQKNQAKFSLLLGDLAQDMPQGAAISAITLTGNDKQPVQVSVTAVDYQTALAVRDSLTASKRISAADIENISPIGSNGNYNVTVVFAFNPGAAR